MKTLPTLMLLAVINLELAFSDEPSSLPKDVPPVVGMAVSSDDSQGWSVELTVPKVTWKVIGEQRPKVEWSRFQVDVEQAVLKLSLDYHQASQLPDESRNRIVDLTGRRLKRDEAMVLSRRIVGSPYEDFFTK